MTIHTVADLIAGLGGRSGAATALSQRSGRKLSARAIDKWRERGALPARWIMAVHAECQARGVDVSLVRLHALAELGQPESSPASEAA